MKRHIKKVYIISLGKIYLKLKVQLKKCKLCFAKYISKSIKPIVDQDEFKRSEGVYN